ncbi:MAG: STAS domain-containing protein [Thermocrispum sp.]
MTGPEPIAEPDVARMLSITGAASGRDSVLVLTVSGELDMLTTDALAERLEAALRPPNKAVVLDLSGVRFLGSAALSALLTGADAAKAGGLGFALVAAGHATLRPFEVTGLSSSFTIHESVTEAVASFD